MSARIARETGGETDLFIASVHGCTNGTSISESNRNLLLVLEQRPAFNDSLDHGQFVDEFSYNSRPVNYIMLCSGWES